MFAPKVSFKPSSSSVKINKRFNSTAVKPRTVTLFKGDGIGPEISDAVIKIFDHVKAPVNWDPQPIGIPDAEGNLVSQAALDSVKRNKLALKGPLGTPIGKGHKSLNLTLRKALGLYANVRPAKSIVGVKTPFDNVDIVVVRENTEGEYSGLEHEVIPGVVESIKLITRTASERIAEYAFKYALENGRKKVTAVHKANIMKKTDGLFLQCCREKAELYPTIKYDEVIIDACCMKMVRHPQQFDVMVMPNLYGDIVSDLASGLIGGLGLTPSGNFGEIASLFEAVHGTAPDIAGQNKANPTALLLSSTMMLKYIGQHEIANKIEGAVFSILKEGKVLTGDLGGNATTTQFTDAIIQRIN